MKKFLALVLIVCFSLVSISAAFANPGKNADRQEKIDFLIEEGLSHDEAVFLVKLEERLEQAEKNGKVIKINDETPDLPDQYMKNNREEFRQRALNLDPAIFKKALASDARMRGPKDIKEMIEKEPGKSKYRKEYPDGSWVEFNTKLTRIDKPTQNGASVNGSESKIIDSRSFDEGNWSMWNEWKEYNGLSYAKIYCETKWTAEGDFDGSELGSTSVDCYYIDGAGASGGIIDVNGQTPYFKTDDTTSGHWVDDDYGAYFVNDEPPIEAVYPADYEVSGSIELSGVFSITVSSSWTQKAVNKLTAGGGAFEIAEIYY